MELIYFITHTILVIIGICIVVFAVFIIALLIDYSEGKRGCIGKLSFERFMHLYAVAPDRWKLMPNWVIYDNFGKMRPREFRNMPSDSHYYFTIIDTIRYILWNRQNEKDEETQRNNKILETDILYWQEDIKRYCEEHNIPMKKEENSA